MVQGVTPSVPENQLLVWGRVPSHQTWNLQRALEDDFPFKETPKHPSVAASVGSNQPKIEGGEKEEKNRGGKNKKQSHTGPNSVGTNAADPDRSCDRLRSSSQSSPAQSSPAWLAHGEGTAPAKRAAGAGDTWANQKTPRLLASDFGDPMRTLKLGRRPNQAKPFFWSSLLAFWWRRHFSGCFRQTGTQANLLWLVCFLLQARSTFQVDKETTSNTAIVGGHLI